MNDPDISNQRACDITLFVACFNEEEAIVATLDTVLAAVAEVGCTYDIVIVDDASTDKSVPIVKEFMAQHPDLPLTLVVNDLNQGLGVNYVEAAFRGSGKYYRTICGDNVETKETLVTVLKRLGEAEILLTYHTDATARTWSRRFISWFYTKLVNLLSGCRIKYYNGLPVMLRYDVMRWHPNSPGFGFQADLVTRLIYMGATYVEIPVVAGERTTGRSNALTFKNLCSVAHSLLEIFVRRLGRLFDGGRYEKLRLNRPHLTAVRSNKDRNP